MGLPGILGATSSCCRHTVKRTGELIRLTESDRGPCVTWCISGRELAWNMNQLEIPLIDFIVKSSSFEAVWSRGLSALGRTRLSKSWLATAAPISPLKLAVICHMYSRVSSHSPQVDVLGGSFSIGLNLSHLVQMLTKNCSGELLGDYDIIGDVVMLSQASAFVQQKPDEEGQTQSSLKELLSEASGTGLGSQSSPEHL